MEEYQIVEPGPLDGSVLTWQHRHRSEDIWTLGRDSAEPVLMIKKTGGVDSDTVDLRILRVLARSGFYGVHKLANMRIDHHLISALVERWRPETHTFHLPVGEVTITLQDVEIILGLPVKGRAVTGDDVCAKFDHWRPYCQNLIGLDLQEDGVKGGNLKMRVLLNHLKNSPPIDVTDEVLDQHARGHILALIGNTLCPATHNSIVRLSYLFLLREINEIGQYSWGSATLAFLYRELCTASIQDTKQIAGCLLLLQIWAWERLLFLSPTRGALPDDPYIPLPLPHGYRWRTCLVHDSKPSHALRIYRDQLDRVRGEQFLWTPYNLSQISEHYQQGQSIWRCRVPLICYEIVEWHFPDRVMRQFGMLQNIPPDCNNGGQKLHDLTRRGEDQHHFSDTAMEQPHGDDTFTSQSYDQSHDARGSMGFERFAHQGTPSGFGMQHNSSMPQSHVISQGYSVPQGYHMPQGYPTPQGYPMPHGYHMPQGYHVPQGYTNLLLQGSDDIYDTPANQHMGVSSSGFGRAPAASYGHHVASSSAVRPGPSPVPFPSLENVNPRAARGQTHQPVRAQTRRGRPINRPGCGT